MLANLPDRRDALAARFPTWEPLTLDAFLDRCAAEFGDRPLVITDDRTLTYTAVADWSRRLADGLAALGVRPGDRVAMLLANHLEFAPVKFAIARAGAVAIPFNFLYRHDELAYVLRQSRCKVLVTMTGFADLDQLGMLDSIAPGWETATAAGFPDLRAVVLLPTDGRGRPDVATVETLTQLGAAAPGAACHTVSSAAVGDILYTSGSTGSPKGVMVSHDAVLRTGYASALTRGFEDGRRVLFALPCYHMFGYVEGLLAAMFVGGAIVPRLTFSAADHLAAVERHRACDVLCVPTMTVALVEHPARHDHDLSSLFAILSGAAAAPVWLWEKVRTELGVTEVTTGYGMTETGGAMTLTRPEDPPQRHSGTVGRPKTAGVAGLPSGALCEYATVDPIDGEPLPEWTEGELRSRGPTHMHGYWDEPEQTAATLHDGWVHSGDLGRVGPDGYLRLTGRSKELYKSGGELVMPKEIEDLMSAAPGVSQAYAVGVPDDVWGEIGFLWVVPEPGANLDPEALLTLCREKLARFKVPKHAVLIAPTELPTTPTGKVQKFALVRLAGEWLRGRAVAGDPENAGN